MILTKNTKNKNTLLKELGNNIRIEGNNNSEHDSFLVIEENGEIYLKNELEVPLIKDKELIVGNKYMCSVNKYKYNPVKPYIYAGFMLSIFLKSKINSTTGDITIKIILSRRNILKKIITENFETDGYNTYITKIYEVCGENYPLEGFEEWKTVNNTTLDNRKHRFDNTEEFIAEINNLARSCFINNRHLSHTLYCYNLKKTKSLQNLIETNIQLIKNQII